MFNTNNKDIIAKLITGGWFSGKDEEDEIFFYKHIKSNKKNMIYHIILSGTEYDGIYELETTSKLFLGNFNKDGITLNIKNNFDYAIFKGSSPYGYKKFKAIGDKNYCIIRDLYKDNVSFMNALIETGFINMNEYNNYTSKIMKKTNYIQCPKLSLII